ncbi:hypothetical protein BJ166DRAFT_473292 [Pestalotiopsis sp. NC0098]|nr:hypothetical protein BJ166DRAFT_473292 [Pestalotiopsis sp. NC0098]
MDSQSFLVTGGCGLQGSDVVQTLRDRYPSAKVAVLSRQPDVNTIPGVVYRRGNITNAAHIDACLRFCQPTVVFHCAATVVGSSQRHIPDHLVREVNVQGTELLLQRCKAAGVKAFVFTSSASVVHWAYVEISGANETWPVVAFPDEDNDDGLPVYPRTKAEAEVLVLAADNNVEIGMRTCAIRPAIIYGERDNDVTPTMMRTAAALRGLQIGDNSKPFATTYVGNSTHAHLLAAEKLLSPVRSERDAVSGQAFFVSNEGRYTYWDFARTMWQYHNENPALRLVSVAVALWVAWASEWWAWIVDEPPRLSRAAVDTMTSARHYDTAKARRVLGYAEQVDWEEGCRRAARWWIENRRGVEEPEGEEDEDEYNVGDVDFVDSDSD